MNPKHILLLAPILLLSCSQRKPLNVPAGAFFPAGVLSEQAASHEFREQWYGKHLRALGEESLPRRVAREDEQVYRLLWLRTFHGPVVARLEVGPKGGVLYFKKTDGAGGYEPGNLVVDRKTELSSAVTSAWIAELNHAGYWTMPTFVKGAGLDGAQWVLEAISDGEYHVVDRWSPGATKYRGVLVKLLTLGGFIADEQGDPVY